MNAKITKRQDYNGVATLIERLGLSPLMAEVERILTGFELRVKEEKDANGGAAVRKLIDPRFQQASGWINKQTGDVDWTKCLTLNGARVCVGVEIQMSARSDLLVIDVSKKHVERVGADKFPLRIIALEHDGPGEPLAKQFKSAQKKR